MEKKQGDSGIQVKFEGQHLVDTTKEPDPDECVSGKCSDKEYFHEGFVIYPEATGKRWEIKIVSIGNWPEFKTDTCYKRVLGVKVPYPCISTCTCDKTFYAQIVLNEQIPNGFEAALKECAKVAAALAVPFVLAGQIGVAVVTFTESLKTCLIAKGFQIASKLSVGIHSRKVCGPWRRI